MIKSRIDVFIKRLFADHTAANDNCHLRLVRDVINATTGTSVKSYDYTAYGKVARNNGASDTDYRYAGLWFHPQSGLNLAKYRAQDPATGRWINRDPIREAGGINLYGYVGGNPANFIDVDGLMASESAAGAAAGSFAGPVGAAAGAVAGAIIGGIMDATIVYYGGKEIINYQNNNEPSDARDPDGAKAPGLPGAEDGYESPADGPQWVPNPNPGKGGSSHGWKDKKGRVWCPTGKGPRAHGGPHWDVQDPKTGGNTNTRPKPR